MARNKKQRSATTRGSDYKAEFGAEPGTNNNNVANKGACGTNQPTR
jgi:hypothetical protein